MFDHIGFDVRDRKRSKIFYEQALAAIGSKVQFDSDEWNMTGFGIERPQFWILQGQPKNGDDEVHVCFAAKNRAAVDAFYAAALSAGGRDNGKPGLRPEYHANYYGAFVFDPDGNNIEACCHGPE